jgi:hypothetical protein
MHDNWYDQARPVYDIESQVRSLDTIVNLAATDYALVITHVPRRSVARSLYVHVQPSEPTQLGGN